MPDEETNAPETWCCIDCGDNTAPGVPTRADIDAMVNEGLPFSVTTKAEIYTVLDDVWKAAGMEPTGGCLCIGCLEKRIGRQLKPWDFSIGHTFNRWPATQRLKNRRD